MAKDTRVAGIYSEIKYKFDPKSLKQLKQFKKDITDLEKRLKGLNKIKARPQVVMNNKKEVAAEKAKAKARKDSTDAARRENKILKSTAKINQKIAQAGITGGAKGTMMSSFKRSTESFRKGKISLAEYNLRLEKSYQKLSPMIAKVKAQRIAETKAAREQKAAIKALSGFYARSAKQSKRLEKQTKKTAMSFKQLRGTLVGMIQAYTAFSATANVMRTGFEFERAGMLMETAMGEQAGPAMEFMRQQSRRLGFDLGETSKGFARYALAAQDMGFSLNEVQNQFLGIAEAATVFGLSQEQITGVIRALEQTASKGQVMAEELKLQLGDRMPAVMGQAAKAMNMQKDEFIKAMEEGKIAAEDFLPAFSDGMRQLAAPGLEKAMSKPSHIFKQLHAMWISFKNDLWQAGLDDLFKDLFYTLKDLMVIMRPLLTGIIAFASAFIRSVIWPIRFGIAVISDLFRIINHYLKQLFGIDLRDVAEFLGVIMGYLASIFLGGGGLIAKGFRFFNKWLNPLTKIKNLVGMLMTRFEKLPAIIAQVTKKMSELPVIGKYFAKSGNMSEEALKAAKEARILRGQRMDTILNRGAQAGAVFNAQESLGLGGAGLNLLVKMTEEGKEFFKIDVESKATDKLNVQTRN